MFITHAVYFIMNVPVVVLNTSFQGSVISVGLCHKPCDLASTIAEPQFRFFLPGHMKNSMYRLAVSIADWCCNMERSVFLSLVVLMILRGTHS